MKTINAYIIESNNDKIWDEVDTLFNELRDKIDDDWALTNEILMKIGPQKSLKILQEIKKKL